MKPFKLAPLAVPGLGQAAGPFFRLLRGSALKAGLPPGTPVHVGEQKSAEVQITVIDYDRDGCRIVTPAEAGECAAFRNPATVSWINVDGLHQVETIQKICACFDLHALTVEDICNTTQRPKLDIFDDHLFLVARMQSYQPAGHGLDSEQFSLVLGRDFVLTFQEKAGDVFDGVRRRITNGKGKIRTMGADYLAYALLDAVVDNYFTVLEGLGEEIEQIEDEVLGNPRPATVPQIHRLRRELILLRKSVWPLREVLNSLMRHEENDLLGAGIAIYLKDLYDHTIQVIDTVETYRDVITGLLDVYLSSLSHRLNEIMKVLTIFAVIFIPLTFIVGLYGMNFDPASSPWNMPELRWYWGYPAALGLMAAVAGGMLIYFKRKNWF